MLLLIVLHTYILWFLCTPSVHHPSPSPWLSNYSQPSMTFQLSGIMRSGECSDSCCRRPMINGKMFISTSNSAKVLTVDSAPPFPLPPRLPLTVRIICLQIEAVGSASFPLPVGSPKVRDCCVLGTMTETVLQSGEGGSKRVYLELRSASLLKSRCRLNRFCSIDC